eukprot:GDKK01026350.1.p2 GENE.GDKK01026350.1~~GDKK01026350.1.p2  ORF type:complete len:119 (+),score=13.98 GDKK01026350.1:93-449(+)
MEQQHKCTRSNGCCSGIQRTRIYGAQPTQSFGPDACPPAAISRLYCLHEPNLDKIRCSGQHLRCVRHFSSEDITHISPKQDEQRKRYQRSPFAQDTLQGAAARQANSIEAAFFNGDPW